MRQPSCSQPVCLRAAKHIPTHWDGQSSRPRRSGKCWGLCPRASPATRMQCRWRQPELCRTSVWSQAGQSRSSRHKGATRSWWMVVCSRKCSHLRCTDRDDDRVKVRSTHEGSGRTYVLIEEQSGGSICPSMFQAIDLSGGAAMISPRFGNCSDVPQVSVSGGALRVSVPAFHAAPATTFVFRDGT